jgi:P27 family predicted phage terminase small subunit
MGRPSQPANLLLFTGRGNGTDSGGRKVKTPPAFRRVAPNPPTWLTREAAAEWRRVVPGLTRLDLLKEEDRAVLAAYCETWSVFVLATRSIKERGLVVDTTTTTRGGDVIEKPIANPAVSLARNAGRELRAFAGQFGLTPAAEMALGKAADDGSEDDNPFGG